MSMANSEMSMSRQKQQKQQHSFSSEVSHRYMGDMVDGWMDEWMS
jgi:hypothetical protein